MGMNLSARAEFLLVNLFLVPLNAAVVLLSVEPTQVFKPSNTTDVLVQWMGRQWKK